MDVKGGTFSIFDNELLSSSNKIIFFEKGLVLKINQDDRCDYNPRCFLHNGLMIHGIICDEFRNKVKNEGTFWKNPLFYQIQHENVYIYKGLLKDYKWKKSNLYIKNMLRSHS